MESVEVYEQSAGGCNLCLLNSLYYFQVATNDEDSG